MSNDRISCNICGCRPEGGDTVEDAIKADWVPSYYEGQDEVLAPVCPDCQQVYLYVAEDGEFVANGT